MLLHNIRNVFASGDRSKWLIPDQGIADYLHLCQQRMGAAYFQTPRDTVKDFVGMLRVIDQNPETNWRQLLQEAAGRSFAPSDHKQEPHERDELSEFQL